jgi:hypothetical protein
MRRESRADGTPRPIAELPFGTSPRHASRGHCVHMATSADGGAHGFVGEVTAAIREGLARIRAVKLRSPSWWRWWPWR